MDNKRYPAKWTDADFNSLSWHDNYVHAIQVRNPEDGYEYDLILDIDHILEWIKGPNARLEFVVAPATLIFHIVEKLTIDIRLAYKEDLIINEIHRTDVSKESDRKAGLQKYRWQINIQSLAAGESNISFEAQGFTQQLTGEPVGPDAGQSLNR